MNRQTMLRALAMALVVALVVPTVASAAWPVASRTSYVSQRFRDGHLGLDIAARHGTRVAPIRSGKVVFAGFRRNCGGYQVWISHGSGLYSAYYHLSRETTARGAWVTTGRYIGNVGRSGCASGPHLHLEVWKGFPWRSGSYRVNPWRYVMSGTWLPYRYR